MRKFNICLIRPEGYIHAYAFAELGELLFFSIKELGYEVILGFNKIENHSSNIIIGGHLLGEEYMGSIPKSSIFINTEQIYADHARWNVNIYKWAKNFQMWDYSARNIEKFQENGVSGIRLMRLGFQKDWFLLKKLNLKKF